MAELRFSALKEVFGRVPLETTPPANNISKYFGIDVFNLHKMEHYLSAEAYKVIKRAINEGKSLTLKEADQVAIGLKAGFAKEVSPLSHWFHPLTDELRKA
jgi:glutamine synthetase